MSTLARACAIAMFVFSVTSFSYAQPKSLIYSFGQEKTTEYEAFSFLIEETKDPEIYYSYGKDLKELKLKYLGKDSCKDKPCFKVEFPNNYTLSIIPEDSALRAIDGTGKYSKVFRWNYEGPVNGIGTFCATCATDENEAMDLIRKTFL